MLAAACCDDALVHIFSFLATSDHIRAALTCHRLYSASALEWLHGKSNTGRLAAVGIQATPLSFSAVVHHILPPNLAPLALRIGAHVRDDRARATLSLGHVQAAVASMSGSIHTLQLAGPNWTLHYDAGQMSRLRFKEVVFDPVACDLRTVATRVGSSLSEREDARARNAVETMHELCHRLGRRAEWYAHPPAIVERVQAPYVTMSSVDRVVSVLATRLPMLKEIHIPLATDLAHHWCRTQAFVLLTRKQLACLRAGRKRRGQGPLVVTAGNAQQLVI